MKQIFTLSLTFLILLNSNLAYAEVSTNKNPTTNISVENKKTDTKTIAILDFDNNTGSSSLDNLKKGLSDSLTNNLSRYNMIQIVERSRLKDAITELSLGQSGIVSTDNAAKIGKVAGSTYVLLGSVAKIGQTYEVSVRVVDVESSRVSMGRSVRSSSDEAIFKSIDYLTLEIANYLGEDISKQALEIARREAESYNPRPNLNWPLMIGGGVVLATAIIGVIIFIRSKSTTTTTTAPKIINRPLQTKSINNSPEWSQNQSILNTDNQEQKINNIDNLGIGFNFSF